MTTEVTKDTIAEVLKQAIEDLGGFESPKEEDIDWTFEEEEAFREIERHQKEEENKQ